MSGKLCAIVTPAKVALVASTNKTVLQLATTSGTNLPRALLKKIGICFDGTSTVAQGIWIQLFRQTTAGTGTTLTPVVVNDFSDAIMSVGAYNFSAEPTNGDLIDSWIIHPQAGHEIILPLGMEVIVKANTRLGIVCNAPSNVNCVAKMWFAE